MADDLRARLAGDARLADLSASEIDAIVEIASSPAANMIFLSLADSDVDLLRRALDALASVLDDRAQIDCNELGDGEPMRSDARRARELSDQL